MQNAGARGYSCGIEVACLFGRGDGVFFYITELVGSFPLIESLLEIRDRLVLKLYSSVGGTLQSLFAPEEDLPDAAAAAAAPLRLALRINVTAG